MTYSFVRLYLFKCDVCVLNYIQIKSKRFLIILYVFGSDFLSLFIFMFSAYLIFHCLNMFCVEKQVSKFFATHSQVTKLEKCIFPTFLCSLAERFTTHSLKSRKRLSKFHEKKFRDSSCDSPNRETPRNSFLKGFSWENCFKPLPSSLKTLFQYFYIKTQPS